MQSRVAFKETEKNGKNFITAKPDAVASTVYSLDAPANEEVACLSLRCLPSKYFFAGEVLPCLPTLSKYLEKY